MINQQSALSFFKILACVVIQALCLASMPVQAIVPHDGLTPDDIIDSEDINGVGMMYSSYLDGSGGGYCTGTLVNPRTVVWARHCVGDEPEEVYGSKTGSMAMAFGFQVDARDSLVNWSQNYQSNPSQAVYNVNQVRYYPFSAEGSYVDGDVAVATLDTPAEGVPTLPMLFSPLPAPEVITRENGTGYHVLHTGYGMTGSGTDGANIDVDGRRRLVENWLGGLVSVDAQAGLQGEDPSGSFPQNVYWTDFDDPLRSNIFDANTFMDDALPVEGATAPGDSGGPLILDQTYKESVILGVLTGGFANSPDAPFSGYSDVSWFQPLYLYWDWIAANNTYHYVRTDVGDGNWEDPDHWLTLLDPNYRSLDAEGNLVNALPTSSGAEEFGADGAARFGMVCDDDAGTCIDVSNGDFYYNGVLTDPDSVITDPVQLATIEALKELPSAAPQALPDPTLENGLPGAKGFVPDNVDPNPPEGIRAHYFDVDLSAVGTTTLGTSVSVDRLTLSAREATLDITTDGHLYSWLGVQQNTGTLQVDGTLSTAGDMVLLSGLLSGHGRVQAPYLTNVAGAIIPGDVAETGTLSVEGNLILSSASGLFIDIGDSGEADLLRVSAASTGDGIASLGGSVLFVPLADSDVRAGNRYTFLQADGGLDGIFTHTEPLSAILSPSLEYDSQSVVMTIDAGDYADVVSADDSVQRAYATLLDGNRDRDSEYPDLYGSLDSMDAPSIQNTLTALAPRTETMRRSLGRVALRSLSQAARQHLFSPLDSSTHFTVTGQPQLTMDQTEASPPVRQLVESMEKMSEKNDPSNMSTRDIVGYMDINVLEGESEPMPTALDDGQDDFSGWHATWGLDFVGHKNRRYGGSLSYADIEFDSSLGDEVTGELYLGRLYGQTALTDSWTLDGQISLGRLVSESRRQVRIGDTFNQLKGDDRSTVFGAELGLLKFWDYEYVQLSSRIGMNYSRIQGGTIRETGGDAALTYEEPDQEELEGSLGIQIRGKGGKVRPMVSLTYFYAFEQSADNLDARLAGSSVAETNFALADSDNDRLGVSMGLDMEYTRLSVNLRANASLATDVESKSLQLALNYYF